MPRPRRDARTPSEIWPGFVDALSTLLLVTIFLLSVFVLAQFFLGQLLAGRDARLVTLREELAAAEDALESERARLDDMRRTLAQLNTDLGIVRGERDTAEAALAETRAARDELDARLTRLADRNRLLAQSLADAERSADREAAERRLVEQALLEAEERLGTQQTTVAAQREQLETLRSDVAALTALREELRRRVDAQREELAELERAREVATAALRDSLEVQAELRAQLEAAGERGNRAEAAAQRAERAAERLRAELAATREQLARIEGVLAEREEVVAAQEVRIDDLDTRLAAALAEEVDELERFRSDFFGRLREVLGEREDVRVVGDRFVFQSEVLFDRAEAELDAGARAQLRDLAATLTDVTADLPPDLPWVLQINGHTDRRPISTARFPSNWELSTARAISVARFLIGQGIPPDRVAAAGFAEYQPIDERDTAAAYRRNRRIEVKLTTR